MRISSVLAVLAIATPAAAMAQTTPAAAPTAAAPAGKMTTADTPIGTLLDNPAAKAIVEKNIPGLTTNDQIDAARTMTLRAIQQYSQDEITDKRLAAIDAELAKLPN